MDLENLNKENFEKEITNYIEKENSSDIHFSPGDNISLRAFGKIKKISYIILTEKDTENVFNFLLSYLTKNSTEHIKKTLDSLSYVGFAITINNLRFRINVSKVGDGFYIVFRNIKSNPPKMEELNFSLPTLNALKYVSELEEGLFLVVGPTGSGKTTTLSSIIDFINDNAEKNIITLEDPIEYVYKPKKCHIVQRELGRDFPFFVNGLNSVMREDPDILLVGEIRDEDSLELALKASETGHLVFATLHTDSAVSTIQRIVSMSSNPTLTRDRLRSCLRGSIAQRLIPLNKKNNGVSVKSRLLLWEILVCSKDISNIIGEGNDIQISGLLDTKQYCQSYNKTLLDYYKQEAVDKEFILKHSKDKRSLLSMLEN
jgi:twitching motility protein PilT